LPTPSAGNTAWILDTHPDAEAFVKNAGVGFGVAYLDNGQRHEFQPEFIVRFRNRPSFHLVLERKGCDPRLEVKRAAAARCVAAVNADGRLGTSAFALARPMEQVKEALG
jgi:type III restriction enzyme